MNKFAKLGLVIGGYMLACLAAYGAMYINQLFTQNASALASGGMYAFGDLILFIGTCGFLSVFPTLLAIFFLVRWFMKRRTMVPDQAS